MAECGEGLTFICHYGLERSRAAANAFNDIGIEANHFVGGTRKIANMPLNELNAAFTRDVCVMLIYDQRSGDEEYKNKMLATAKLDKLGIDYTVVDTASLAIMLYERGLDIDNYL